jgi:DNA-binding MarR family transcriptional regulator
MANPPTLSERRTTSEAALAARLRLTVTRLARRLRQQASEPGVSPTQIAALSTIERMGPITLGDLAREERVQPPTVTAAVGRLEESGLVRRRVDPEDRRVNRVEITAAGRRLLQRSRSAKTAFLARRLHELDADDRATLDRAAAILEHLLDEDRT